MNNRNNIGFGRRVDQIEETVIAVILGLMTVVTFSNVIARYVFNENLLWALEVTLFLFAWLVLLGASYCVKKDLHLGIDVVVNMLPTHWRRVMALIGVVLCLIFSLLLLKGSWDYWYPFVTTRAFLETEDVPMPEFLQFFRTNVVNVGVDSFRNDDRHAEIASHRQHHKVHRVDK